MELLITILLLLALVGYYIIRTLQPKNPPIEDMREHLKYIQSFPNQKARQKYLRNLRKITNINTIKYYLSRVV